MEWKWNINGKCWGLFLENAGSAKEDQTGATCGFGVCSTTHANFAVIPWWDLHLCPKTMEDLTIWSAQFQGEFQRQVAGSQCRCSGSENSYLVTWGFHQCVQNKTKYNCRIRKERSGGGVSCSFPFIHKVLKNAPPAVLLAAPSATSIPLPKSVEHSHNGKNHTWRTVPIWQFLSFLLLVLQGDQFADGVNILNCWTKLYLAGNKSMLWHLLPHLKQLSFSHLLCQMSLHPRWCGMSGNVDSCFLSWQVANTSCYWWNLSQNNAQPNTLNHQSCWCGTVLPHQTPLFAAGICRLSRQWVWFHHELYLRIFCKLVSPSYNKSWDQHEHSINVTLNHIDIP